MFNVDRLRFWEPKRVITYPYLSSWGLFPGRRPVHPIDSLQLHSVRVYRNTRSQSIKAHIHSSQDGKWVWVVGGHQRTRLSRSSNLTDRRLPKLRPLSSLFSSNEISRIFFLSLFGLCKVVVVSCSLLVIITTYRPDGWHSRGFWGFCTISLRSREIINHWAKSWDGQIMD